jgi:hypothetical protein
MLGLTPLGTFHTAISLIAVAAGIAALVRDKRISMTNLVGKIYWLTTVITVLSGFGISSTAALASPTRWASSLC